MLTTAADLFRNLALAWWPLLLVAALVALPWLLVAGLRWLDRDMSRGIQRIDLDDLIDGDTWALDYYLDANRAGYERLLDAVDDPFLTTRLEIAALPETRTR